MCREGDTVQAYAGAELQPISTAICVKLLSTAAKNSLSTFERLYYKCVRSQPHLQLVSFKVDGNASKTRIVFIFFFMHC